MGNTFTTSIRCGSSFSQKHNNRDKATMASEKQKEESLGLKFHIREDGEHITFRHKDIKEVYKKVFNDALTEYNEKQIAKGHKERVITDYYEHIKKDKKRNPAYEIIVQVGNKDNPVDDATLKKIYEKYLNEWKERNPHFYIIGCYFHNDEGTKDRHTSHLHIDYLPISYQNKTGLKVQCNQKQSFKEMSIEGTKSRTAQMIWQERENDYLIKYCNEMGISIENPKENAQRISRTVYELKEQKKEIEENNNNLRKVTAILEQENQELIKQRVDTQKHITGLLHYGTTLKKEKEELAKVVSNIFESYTTAVKDEDIISIDNRFLSIKETFGQFDREYQKGQELSKTKVLENDGGLEL